MSAFRLCCVQAYADGLAAKHFEQQNKITELERSSSVILFCCSKCLAKAEADAKAGSFGNFRPLRVLAKLWNCLLDLKSPFEFRSLRMIDANLIFSHLSFANWLVNISNSWKRTLLYGCLGAGKRDGAGDAPKSSILALLFRSQWWDLVDFH